VVGAGAGGGIGEQTLLCVSSGKWRHLSYRSILEEAYQVALGVTLAVCFLHFNSGRGCEEGGGKGCTLGVAVWSDGGGLLRHGMEGAGPSKEWV